MEHYDWNEGWLFAPDSTRHWCGRSADWNWNRCGCPTLCRCLPYNYCNEK